MQIPQQTSPKNTFFKVKAPQLFQKKSSQINNSDQQNDSSEDLQSTCTKDQLTATAYSTSSEKNPNSEQFFQEEKISKFSTFQQNMMSSSQNSFTSSDDSDSDSSQSDSESEQNKEQTEYDIAHLQFQKKNPVKKLDRRLSSLEIRQLEKQESLQQQQPSERKLTRRNTIVYDGSSTFYQSMLKKERIDLTQDNKDADVLLQVLQTKVKNPEEIEYLMKTLQGMKAFEQHKDLIFQKKQIRYYLQKTCTHQEFKKHQTLFHEGEFGFEYFIVLKGAVWCLKDKAPSKDPIDTSNMTEDELFLHENYNQKQIVHTFTPGQAFGEIALLNKSRRTATMVCKENTDFMVITRQGFENVLQAAYESKRKQKISFMKTFNFFNHTNESLLESFLYDSEPVQYKENALIYAENDISDKVYFIQKGMVEISEQKTTEHISQSFLDNENTLQNDMTKLNNALKKKKYIKTSQRIPLILYSQGSFFGELEFLQKKPKRFTMAKTKEETQLYVFDKKKLTFFLQQSETYHIFKQEASMKHKFQSQRLSQVLKHKESQRENKQQIIINQKEDKEEFQSQNSLQEKKQQQQQIQRRNSQIVKPLVQNEFKKRNSVLINTNESLLRPSNTCIQRDQIEEQYLQKIKREELNKLPQKLNQEPKTEQEKNLLRRVSRRLKISEDMNIDIPMHLFQGSQTTKNNNNTTPKNNFNFGSNKKQNNNTPFFTTYEKNPSENYATEKSRTNFDEFQYKKRMESNLSSRNSEQDMFKARKSLRLQKEEQLLSKQHSQQHNLILLQKSNFKNMTKQQQQNLMLFEKHQEEQQYNLIPKQNQFKIRKSMVLQQQQDNKQQLSQQQYQMQLNQQQERQENFSRGLIKRRSLPQQLQSQQQFQPSKDLSPILKKQVEHYAQQPFRQTTFACFGDFKQQLRDGTSKEQQIKQFGNVAKTLNLNKVLKIKN